MGYQPKHRIVQAVRSLSWRVRAMIVAGVVVLTGGGALAASAATAGGPVISGGQLQGTVYVCVQLNNESHQYVELHSQVAGNCPSGYVQYHVNQSTSLGLTAPPSATASTSVSNDPDSGNNGTWATDTFVRTASVNRVGQVASSNCAGHSPCYLYSGQVTDSGTFVTVASAKSPNAGVTLPATPVQGTLNGAIGYEFYSTAAAPDASPPATLDNSSGAGITSGWPLRFFRATDPVYSDSGTLGAVTELNDWSWVYNYAPCSTDNQTWVDSHANHSGSDASAGDITGANTCPGQ